MTTKMQAPLLPITVQPSMSGDEQIPPKLSLIPVTEGNENYFQNNQLNKFDSSDEITKNGTED